MSELLREIDESDFLLQAVCADFLSREAELLDDWKFRDWLELLTDDIVYKVPVVSTKEDVQAEFSDEAYFFDEDFNSLRTRVKRLESDFVWSEVPRSHTRRIVSNVRVQEENGNEVVVKNNCLFNFVRDHKEVTFTYERHDTLRQEDGRLRLAERRAYLDSSNLPTQLVHFL